MPLTPLCSIELTAAGEVASVRPFATGEGSEFELGIGTVSGERLAGECRYSQRLARRSDGLAELELHGALTTTDGALLMLTAHGNEGADGRGLLVVTLEAQDERYRWLNPLILIGECRFDPDHLHAHIEISEWSPA